jgi:hypothetical protein
MKSALVTAIALAFISSPALAETFACLETAASGFDYKDKGWRPTQFLEQKFILSFDGDIATATFDIFGKSVYKCDLVWPTMKPHVRRCVGLTDYLLFNAETLRFTVSFNFGEAGNTPTETFHDSLRVGYGVCQPFK